MSLNKVHPLMEQIPLSGVLGGTGVVNHLNSFTLGSNLSSNEPNFVYVNNLSATDLIYGDGRYMTNVATLNPVTQLINPANLPSYVDDVLEFADLASLPNPGETGKIYVTLDDRLIYRWTGTLYIEISKSAQPSEIGTIPKFTKDYVGGSGTSALYSREDHVHPPDTTRLALTGGDLSGKLTIEGSLSANGDIYTTKSLFASGSLNANGDLRLDGSVYAAGSLSLSGSENIAGNITFTANNSARYIKAIRDDGFEQVLVFGGTSTGDSDSSIHPFYALNGRGGPISPDYHQDNIRHGADLRNIQYGDNTISRNFVLSGTPTVPEAVGADKAIGGIKGFAYSGDDTFLSYGAGGNASIELFTDGLQSMENAGGYITLNTTPSSAGLAGGLQERMRIASNGSIYIGSNATTLQNATGITQQNSNPTANSRMVNIHSCDGRALLVVSNETTSYNPSISIKGGAQPSIGFTHTLSGNPYWQLTQANVDGVQGYPINSVSLRHVTGDNNPSPIALMTMLSSGEVGFGTTTPRTGQGRSVHVYNNLPALSGALANANVTVESVNRNAYFYARTTGAGSQAGFTAINSATNDQFGSIFIGSDGTTRFTTGSAVSETMRIAPTGDIAIGTITPSTSARLTVAGSISAKDFLYGDGRYIPNVILNRFGIDQSTQNAQGSFVVGINALPNEAANSTPVLTNVNYSRTVTTLSLTVGPSHGLSVNDYIKISNAPTEQIELNGVFRIIGVDTSVVYVENPTTSILSGNSLTVQKSLRNNVAIGQQALNSLTSGTNNLAIGFDAATGTTTSSNSVAIGNASSANGCGTAVGQFTNADSWGAAIGTGANANSNGVAVGYNAVACNGGVAVGRDSNTANYNGAIALGREAFATDRHLAIGSPGFPLKNGAVVCGRVMEVNLNGSLGYIPVYTNSLSALPTGTGGTGTDTNKLPLSGGNITGDLTVSGNVGIGTLTPNEKLTISGNISASCHIFAGNTLVIGNSESTTKGLSATLRLVSDNTGRNHIQSGANYSSNSAAPLIFSTMLNGSEWARFDANGNFGIGTNAPGNKLDVKGTISANYGVCGLGFYHSNGTNSDFKTETTDGLTTIKNSVGSFAFATANTEKVRITTAGNVGIGTTTPITASGYNSLTINSTTSGGRVDLLKNGSQFGLVYSAGPNLFDVEATGTDTAMRFNTNLCERMRISHNGNIGLGTSTPETLLHVNKLSAGNITETKVSNYSCSNNSGARYTLATGCANHYGIWEANIGSGVPSVNLASGDGATNGFFFSAGSSTNNQPMIFRQGVTERLRISSCGNVGIGTNTPTAKLSVCGTTFLDGVVNIGRQDSVSEGAQIGLARAVDNAIEWNLDAFGCGTGTRFRIHKDLGGEKMTILDNGNVGFGTVNPPSRLSVYGGSELGLFSGTRDSNGFAGVRIQNESTTSQATSSLESKTFFDFANGVQNVANIHSVMGVDGSANLYFSTTPAGCKFVDRRAERLIISGSGNVGIGASLPNERLTIGGSISATGDVCINGKFRGDGSMLTGISVGGTSDTTKLPLSGGNLTGTLCGTTICATNICGTHYGSGANLTGVTGTDSTKLPLAGGTLSGTLCGTTICATNICGTHYGSGANLTGVTGTDSTKLPLAGGSLSGTLCGTTICATNICGTHYGSGANLTGVTATDSTKLPLAGGNLTGTLCGTTICATTFCGSGAGLTNLPSSIVSNTLVTSAWTAASGNVACYSLFTNNARTTDTGNTIDVSRYSTVLGGLNNSIRGGSGTILAGPYQYPWDLWPITEGGAILGGSTNSLSAVSNSAIVGGTLNVIGVCNQQDRNARTANSVIIGGACHSIIGGNNVIAGGCGSTIGSGIIGTVVLGSGINGNVSNTVFANSLSLAGVVNSGPIDSLAPNIVTLIQANEANGSTTVSDSSLYSNSYSLVNGSTVSNTSAKFGGTSVYLNGNQSSSASQPVLRTAETDVVNFGTEDFTIEFWLSLTTPAASPTIFDTRFTSIAAGTTVHNGSLTLWKTSTTIGINTGYSSVAASYTFNSAWNHIAVTRKDFVTRVYVNGSAVITVTNDFVNYGPRGITFGANADTSYGLNGYLDEVIITKRVARYTANFTPAAAAYTVPAKSVKLPYIDANSGTFNSFVSANRYLGDGSGLSLIPYTVNQSITATDSVYAPNLYIGDPYEKFITLNLTTDYIVGNGTYYRDLTDLNTITKYSGSADILYSNTITRPGGGATTLRIPGRGEGTATKAMLISNNYAATRMEDRDFTVEAWIYPISRHLITYILDCRNQGTFVNTGINSLLFLLDANGAITNGQGTVFANTVCPLSAWSHIALQRTGGYMYAYLNGVKSPTNHPYPYYVNNSGGFTIGNAADFLFGENNGTGGYFLDTLRVFNGVARYPVEGFDVPTECPSYHQIGGQVHFTNSVTESKITQPITFNALSIDTSLASLYTVTLNNNITAMSFTRPPAYNLASSFMLQLVGDGTPRTVAWPSSVKWPSSVIPTVNSANGKIDTYSFLTYDSGVNWYGYIMGQNH